MSDIFIGIAWVKQLILPRALGAAAAAILILVGAPQHPETIVVDEGTGLIWTRDGNGEDIDWTQADEYCENLTLAEFSDWRLPTIDELETLYDAESGVLDKIRGPFQLSSPVVWSSTKEGSDSAWFYHFNIGRRVLIFGGLSKNLRALCVRRSGE